MDRYAVIGLLGEGSFGRVYKAKQLSDSTFVALKVISKRGRSSKELKDLRGECKIQKHLSHPNIIQMLDSFETENEIVVITEFAHKELNTVLGKEGYLTEDRVQCIVWDLISALYYLHSHRVLHRDLKPQNILIDSENRAKLCDFGFARNMSTGTHVLTSIKGTPLYMAPELIEEQPYDHSADLWSLGCIIYELLVGAPPFCTPSILQLIRLIRHEQIQWPTFISDNCISFLKGLLQKNPSKRLSWQEILNHPFIKGHIIVSDETGDQPLTRTFSVNTLQAKEQQRQDHVSNKINHIKSSDVISSSTNLKDLKNNNISLSTVNSQIKNLSLDNNSQSSSNTNTITTKTSINNNDDSLKLDLKSKLNFIEENHPIETDEWIVFLQKSIEEIIVNNDMLSLTQPNLTSIVILPLRNSNASPKVLNFVAKLLCMPFALTFDNDENGVIPPDNLLNQITKVYLEIKLVPNLMYSTKLLLREKKLSDINDNNNKILGDLSASTTLVNLQQLSTDDFNTLDNYFMLIAHLIHLDNEFLSQLCDAIVVLNVYSIFELLLSVPITATKQQLQIVRVIFAILTHILRVFPENYELVDKIILTNRTKSINFVEFLHHYDALLRERACLCLLYLGRCLPPASIDVIWNGDIRETLETLMYDSIESVRNAAGVTVEELKKKDFYNQY